MGLAPKEQREGRCRDSIKTNEEPLRESPPLRIKVRVYLSLAECYEKEGGRVEDIRRKTALFKSGEGKKAE